MTENVQVNGITYRIKVGDMYVVAPGPAQKNVSLTKDVSDKTTMSEKAYHRMAEILRNGGVTFKTFRTQTVIQEIEVV